MQAAGGPVQWTGWTEYLSAGRSDNRSMDRLGRMDRRLGPAGPAAPRLYHAHAPAVPLPLALALLALGPGFEKMFRANISTQHMLETFARLALHDDERHGRRVRRGRAATRDVPPRAPCAVRRLPATFLSLSVFLSCSFSRLISLCLLELAGAISSASDRRLRRQRRRL